MSKQANKTLIGAFVLGAVALVVAGVIIFGKGGFFTYTETYVLYFKGSVKGLSIGSPVMFRGVKIGTVKDISLDFDPEDLTVYIPVIIEIEPDRFRRMKNRKPAESDIDLLVEKGLRGQLQVLSFVTGQLVINFDFMPEEPLVLTGIKSDYPELPTIPSDIEKFSRALENIPFEEIFTNLADAIKGVQSVLSSPELAGTFKYMQDDLKEIQQLVKNIDREFGPLAQSVRKASEEASKAFMQAGKTLSMEEGVSAELASGIKETLASAREVLKTTEQTLSSVRGITAEDSHVRYELSKTLRELSSAARSIRFLADYLERHPEALIRGKHDSGEK